MTSNVDTHRWGLMSGVVTLFMAIAAGTEWIDTCTTHLYIFENGRVSNLIRDWQCEEKIVYTKYDLSKLKPPHSEKYEKSALKSLRERIFDEPS